MRGLFIAQYARVVRWIMLAFMGLVVFMSVSFSAARKVLGEFPDAFVHENIFIAEGQVI